MRQPPITTTTLNPHPSTTSTNHRIYRNVPERPECSLSACQCSKHPKHLYAKCHRAHVPPTTSRCDVERNPLQTLLKPRFHNHVLSFAHFVFYHCGYDWVRYATEILAFLEHIGTKNAYLQCFRM